MITVYDMASGEVVSVEPPKKGRDPRTRQTDRTDGVACALQHCPSKSENAPRLDMPTSLATIDCEIFIRLMDEPASSPPRR